MTIGVDRMSFYSSSELGIKPDTSGARATVLLAEDEVFIRIDLAEQLRSGGYQVIEAGSGDEAIAVLNTGVNIDLLITDLEMPGSLKGHALVRFTRRAFPKVKIIVASAQTFSPTSDCTADAAFVKPYDLSMLLNRVRELTSKPADV